MSKTQPLDAGSASDRAAKKGAYLAFVLLGVIWGSNFIFMKWAAETISPSQIVLLRVVFGFLPILFVALAKGALRWDHGRHAHHFVVMSLLATAIYYLAFAKGTALLPSSIAGLLSGAIPLFTFICAWLFLREEHINGNKATGVALGFLGVLLIARPWSSSAAIDMVGVACMLAGSMSVGCSFVYARKFISPLQLPAVALTTYQIGLAMIVLFRGDAPRWNRRRVRRCARWDGSRLRSGALRDGSRLRHLLLHRR